MASGALRLLRQRGLRVPEDVAVVGFDDIVSVAEWTDPPLTTIRQDIEEMGRMMARLLLRRIDPPEAGTALAPNAGAVLAGSEDASVPLSPIVTRTKLVVRASA
jgi:DNA-binding LacI/PurR family transcriptional regulator